MLNIWIWVCATTRTTSARYRPNLVYFSLIFLPCMDVSHNFFLLEDLIPLLMMVSWPLEAPRILNVFLSYSIHHLCMKVNFVAKMVAESISSFQQNLRRSNDCKVGGKN